MSSPVPPELLALQRMASVAQVGGFRPPSTPRSSWIGSVLLGAPGADVPFNAPHGEGWELRTYESTDDLVPLVEPERDDELTLRPFPLLWRPRVELPSNDDIPPDLHELRWEFGDDGELFDLDGLKVGGWPRTVQAEVDWQLPGGRVSDAEFVFQVDSDEKARLNVVDGGVFYVGWSPTERWLLSCQFL